MINMTTFQPEHDNHGVKIYHTVLFRIPLLSSGKKSMHMTLLKKVEFYFLQTNIFQNANDIKCFIHFVFGMVF